MSVPGEEDGSARWSLDHLFLDQDAVPTLIEVKRSSDTRIRREVVGQMLDYAANAVIFWPVEEIRAKFESRCEKSDEDSEEVLTSFLGKDQDIDGFWQHVKTNLQAGRVRMVFLADSIPTELRRVVEFLNEQMDPAEVLAIEVKQFVGTGVRTLVPRVLGQTETAKQKKTSSAAGPAKITEADFMGKYTASRTAEEVAVVRQLMKWSENQGLENGFRQRQNGTAYLPIVRVAGQCFFPISVQQRGNVVIQMRWLKDHPPFDAAAKRDELFERIKNIPGLRVSDAGMEGFPKFPISSLTDNSQFTRFRDAFAWIISEIRATIAKWGLEKGT